MVHDQPGGEGGGNTKDDANALKDDKEIISLLCFVAIL